MSKSPEISREGKGKVLVFGLARSGQAAMALLLSSGVRVLGADERIDITLPPSLSGAKVELGDFASHLLDGVSETVLSPGVPAGHPVVTESLSRGIPVLSELELAYRYAQAPVIAVTGTNGKSTTVSMIGEILKEDGRQAIVAGNVGIPFSSVVTNLGSDGYFVIEVSSFQLESVEKFHPISAGILNLTPDHLDRYASEEEYYGVKEKIIENLAEEDIYFYNAADPLCSVIASRSRARAVPFSSRMDVPGEVFLDGGSLKRKTAEGGEEIFMEKDKLGVIGLHNVENALAAVASLQGVGVSTDACRRALVRFHGLPHRMEKVAELSGVTYFNDSKATNVEAAVKSLAGLERPVVLIAGGYDKGSDYTKLSEVGGVIKSIITIGKAAPLIEEALEGLFEIDRADDMDDAVRKASAAAEKGDFVVLSPACASFDMFRDFEHRGDVFKESVLSMGEPAS